MKEFKVTRERILDACGACEEARDVLGAMFPEAFEEEGKWEDITRELKWRIEFVTPYYYVAGYYKGERIVNLDMEGAWMPNFPGDKNFKVERDNRDFRILKKKQ